MKAIAIAVGATTIAVVLSSREPVSSLGGDAVDVTEIPLPL